jgi:hypothetical protein
MVLCVVEGLSGLLSRRALFLKNAILTLIGRELGGRVLSNSLISSLGFVRSNGMAAGVPSYVPSRYFARALLAEIERTPDAPSVTLVRDLIEMVVGDANASLAVAEQRLAAWFDAAMDRLSGMYKRHTQRFAVVIAALLVVATNADSIRLSNALWKDDGLRARYSALADEEVKTCEGSPDAPPCREITRRIATADALPLGWNLAEMRALDVKGWALWLLGLALSALAVSRGAPFWFDALRKLSPGFGNVGPRPAVAVPAPPATESAPAAPPVMEEQEPSLAQQAAR